MFFFFFLNHCFHLFYDSKPSLYPLPGLHCQSRLRSRIAPRQRSLALEWADWWRRICWRKPMRHTEAVDVLIDGLVDFWLKMIMAGKTERASVVHAENDMTTMMTMTMTMPMPMTMMMMMMMMMMMTTMMTMMMIMKKKTKKKSMISFAAWRIRHESSLKWLSCMCENIRDIHVKSVWGPLFFI